MTTQQQRPGAYNDFGAVSSSNPYGAPYSTPYGNNNTYGNTTYQQNNVSGSPYLNIESAPKN
jgi:hypothetical protein